MEIKTILAGAVMALLFTVDSPAATITWNGSADSNIGTAGNWSTSASSTVAYGQAPQTGDVLQFAETGVGAGALTSINDNQTGASYGGLVFLPTGGSLAGPLTISGNAFTLTGTGTATASITNNNTTSGRNVTINDNITISGSQEWVATSNNAITILNGNLSDSSTSDVIAINGNGGSNGTNLPTFQLNGSNSSFLGTINFEGSDNGGILLGSASAMTGGLIDTTTGSHDALWLTANSAGAAYTFGIQGTQTTGARVNVSGSGGNGFFLTANNSGVGGGTIYWDPGNGSTYNWSGTSSTGTVLTWGGSTDTNPDTMVIGNSGSPESYFEISGASKSFLVYESGNNPGYVTLADGLEAGTSGLTLTTQLTLLTLTQQANTATPLAITVSNKNGEQGNLSISNVNQLPGGNLNLSGGVLILNGVSWDTFAASYGYGTGNSQYQVGANGGFAATGNGTLTIDSNSTNGTEFGGGLTLGSAVLTSTGAEYAPASITLQPNISFSAATGTINVAGNSTENTTTGLYTLGSQIMTLTGILTGHSSTSTYTLNSLSGGESLVPIVELTNASNSNLNLITAGGSSGSPGYGMGVLVATSDGAFGSGTVTIQNGTPSGAPTGWLVLLAGGYTSSQKFFYTSSASPGTTTPWGLGSYTGNDIYTGVTTINDSSSTTETLNLNLDAESGSTFQLGTSGTAATLTNNSNAAQTLQYRKTGAGTVILNNVTYNGADANAVQFNIQNGALQETGGTAANSVYGSALTLSGGVLETNNTNENAESGGTTAFTRSLSTTLSSSNINMTNGGGFSAYGGALTVALGGTSAPTAITWGSGGTSGWVASTSTLVFGSQTANNVVTFQNAINLNGGVRNIQVVGTGTANEAVLTGVVNGSSGSGINLTGSGDLLLTNTDTYVGNTNVNGGTFLVNGTTGTATSVTTVASGAAVGGSGTINGSLVINAGGAINLHGSTSGTTIGTPVIGTLTVGSLTLNNTSGSSLPALTFDITSGGTSLNNGNLDKIVDNGALTIGGTNGITITVDNLTGSLTTGTTLATGTYTLLSYANGTQLTSTQAGYFSLSNSTLDGDSLSLLNGTKALQLVIGANVVTGTYTMATTAGGSSSARILVSTSGETTGTSTALSTVLNNTGSSSSTPPADSINVTGLGATSTPSTTAGVTGSTAGSNTNVADSGSLTNSSQIFSSATTGTYTISPTVSTATGASGSGAATDTGTTTASVVVVNERSFTAAGTSTGTLALGRFLINTAPTGTVTVASTGLNGTTATATLTTFSGSSTDGLSLGTGNSLTYNGSSSTQTDTFTLSGTAGASTGTVSGTFSSTPTDEFGNTLSNVTVALTGDAVAKRTITNGASTSLGVLHSGATVSGTANAFSSSGTNATTTSVQVAGGSGSADSNGVTLTGSTSSFTGATSGSVNGSTQTFGGTITNATGGTTSGTFSLAATTLENGGAGLAGEGSYSPVSVAYSSYVYTGTGSWTGTGGTASWGTSQSTAPANWVATGGIPGITPGFLTTDSAYFGSSITSNQTVNLSGASPYLKAITFNNAGNSYDIEQGGTGTIHLDSTGTATITDSAGNHTIGAPIELDSASATSVASSSTLTINGVIGQSGTQSLTIGGAGTTALNGANSFGGGTTVNAGSTLLTGNGSGSATGSGALSVAAGATLGGTGIINGSSFTIGNTGTAAKVVVGTGTDTTSGMTLEGSGSNSITNTTLAFNISAATVGQGNQLSVGNSAITFSNSTLALNVSGIGIIPGYSSYVLVAGTGNSQYSGLGLTEESKDGTMFDVITAGLTLSFTPALANTWYATNSFLYLNTAGGVDDIDVEVVPEPGTWALMLGGLAMLIFWQRRKHRS